MEIHSNFIRNLKNSCIFKWFQQNKSIAAFESHASARYNFCSGFCNKNVRLYVRMSKILGFERQCYDWKGL